jgi:hypothetical protein
VSEKGWIDDALACIAEKISSPFSKIGIRSPSISGGPRTIVLMTREITHMKAFMAALDSMGKDRLSIGKIPPTPGIVDEFCVYLVGDADGDVQFAIVAAAEGAVAATAVDQELRTHETSKLLTF